MKLIKKICLVALCVLGMAFSACKTNVDEEANLPNYEIFFENKGVVIHPGEGAIEGEMFTVEPGYYLDEYTPAIEDSDYIIKDGGDVDYSVIYSGRVPELYDTGKSENTVSTIKPGQLTASALFDNDDYNYWLSLQEKGQEVDGIFKKYQDTFKIANNRITLKIKGVKKAQVTLYGEDNNIEWVSYADKNGICYLFNSEEREEYKVSVSYLNNESEVKISNYTVKNNEEIEIKDESMEYDIIQLMFIIDTTGSMMDEIDYLKAEIKDVISRIKEKNNCRIYLSIMLYRDTYDNYITKYYEFTEDIDAQVNNLSGEYAGGGGDFEEAVQIAFEEAVEKQWLEIPSTKVLIHVADAPSHDKDVDSWMDSVKKLSGKGVRIINVASSGIDKKTEFLFRNECVLTNGCYTYLTNHSHIGSYHIDATTSNELEVEYLNDLLVRVIDGMYTGTYAAPINYMQVVPEE